MKIVKLMAAVVTMATCTSYADEGWKISTGFSYRSFGDIQLKSQSQGNSTNGQYLDGSITTIDNSAQVIVSIDNAIEQSLAGSPNTYLFNTIENGFSENDFDSSVNLIFKAEKSFWENENWSGVFEIAVSGLNSHDSYSSQGTTTTTAVEFSSLLQDGENIDVINGQYVLADGEAFSSNHNIRLNMFSLSLGGSLKYQVDNFFVSIGAGPSLTFLDSEIKQELTLSSGETLTDSGHYSDFKAGLYADCSLGYNFLKKWALGINYRYDWIPQELDNDLVEIELSGQSFGAFISYQF